MDLRHVSSRELAGKKLQGYDKREIVYENLSPEDVKRMSANGDVDCWVMALPNGVCKPFVDAVDQGSETGNVIVDLSADYRFDDKWTYGLPELVNRGKIAQATRISNPGCYATAAQIGIAPLVPYLGGQPTVFGVSGYSGAGTKPSPKNDVQNLTNNIIPYSLTDHIHEREISTQLGTSIAFIPHVAVWFQGIHVCTSLTFIYWPFFYMLVSDTDFVRTAHHQHSSQPGDDFSRHSQHLPGALRRREACEDHW
jgi:N-acetyl-gamma-glutamyl-phosphate reductase/acetylglutamate kinase